MPSISTKKSKAKWSDNLSPKEVSRVGSMTRSKRSYDKDGFLTASASRELEKIANKALRVNKGRQVDGLRCKAPEGEVLCADVFEYLYADRYQDDDSRSFDYYEGDWDSLL